MKKFKKFLKSKGGILSILGTILLLLLAGFLIIVGVVYSNYGGNWGIIPELLTSNFAIAMYVILGLVIFFLLYIAFIFARNEEIE